MTEAFATHLRAPEPGWTEEADVVVIGSGIAGLSVALRAQALGRRVLLITKASVEHGSTAWAQGGIAAAMSEDDSPEDHLVDTLNAGAGLCDEEAVRVLVTQGPGAVRRLVELGTRFDLTAAGDLALTREGGHLRDRIAHAGGDATGAEIVRALVSAVRENPGITVYERALALDLLTDSQGSVQGVTLHVMGQGQRDGVGAAIAPAVVIATGGIGQVFQSTTNPEVATGDGVAMAIRAGAAVADLEFVQFHPTVLWMGARSSWGQQPLVSEAVRGEGAVLLDVEGRRFMAAEHPMADLAPRDIVAKAVVRRMIATGADHVWLDGRALGEEVWSKRFPTILARCRELGVDPVSDRIPVAPAQHYASGGIRTDLDGRSSIPGLFACGEAACTGVHGANRLASNSLLEGLVFAERITSCLELGGLPRRDPCWPSGPVHVVSAEERPRIQQAMSHGVGLLRSAKSLQEVTGTLRDVAAEDCGEPCTAAWETSNILTVASVLTLCASQRTETRGSHWREDFPASDDEHWLAHLTGRVVSGRLETTKERLGSPRWEAWQ
ncbi:MAG: L-aspartate oxidase [Candidatus Nanopelagicales bacterium]|nr:L-aspartate oxidase [Candidatus Nanopelagicales bacterium]MDZ4249719.1 L-aspartate oxidase [Candidatus Nanopelagicales bacterium]